MLQISGKIISSPPDVSKKHKKQSNWKSAAIVQFNDDFCNYYRWFLKKEFGLTLNQPLRGSHITVVNDRTSDMKDGADIMDINGKEITVYYDPLNIRSNNEHWWINAESKDIEDIRESLGLCRTPYFGLHLTIGMSNELNREMSEFSRIYSIRREGL